MICRRSAPAALTKRGSSVVAVCARNNDPSLQISATRDYDFLPMSVLCPRRARRSVSMVVALTLLAATLLTLVHWHKELPGQRCELCLARHLPSIYVPFTAWLATPTLVEWRLFIEKPTYIQTASFQFDTSRAPPPNSFL